LRIQEPGAGYCHFPIERSDEYFKQLTAEKLVIRYVRGHAKRVWVKTRPRNEALDVRCYAMAAYSIIGVNVNTIASKMERSVKPESEEAPREPTTREKLRPSRRRQGGFVNQWR